ncbi:MAG: response regulator transcription factor [Clostridiales bacterium]|nr:response regulator transcription factor [Clostridiales bacterium]
MIPIYLCEDDKFQLECWRKIISNTILINEWDMKIKAACVHPDELLRIVNKSKPENAVYFLDIDLKSRVNGIQLAVEIRKYDPRAFIIFVTTHEEMALHTFQYKVEPLGYIIKEAPDFKDQIRDCLQNVYEKYQVPNNPVTDVLAVRMEYKLLIIPYDEIYYIEPSSQSHRIRLHKDHEILEFSSSLTDIKSKLDKRFFMCHKSYIVNCNHISRVDKKTYTVHFKNGHKCPCSVRLCNQLCNKLNELSKP